VGRKWVNFDAEAYPGQKWNAGRFDIETGAIDGGDFTSPGRVHKDEAAWRAREDAKETFRQFRQALQYRDCPPGVTAADIITAAELLKLDLKP
jgi:hypothetical protein